MNQQYFILVFAHSLHGRLRRVHIPQSALYVVLGFALLGCFSTFGFISSYLRMTWKVANYNALRTEVDTLRVRYQSLQRQAKQREQQLASFQILANEITSAYGIKKKLEGPADIASEGRLVPTVAESLEEYNFLKSANLSRYFRPATRPWQTQSTPNLWPIEGRLMSHFGARNDPFSGEGVFHTGVDLMAQIGTPVRVTGDGTVSHAEYSGRYGKLIVVDHGGNVQTYYAHLSRQNVVAGQEVRRGEIIGFTGASGRVTGPHLHYEVRVGGTPMNPYSYLSKAGTVQVARKDLLF